MPVDMCRTVPHTSVMDKRREQPRVTIRLKPMLYEALLRLADSDNRSVQQLGERAFENYLTARKADVDAA